MRIPRRRRGRRQELAALLLDLRTASWFARHFWRPMLAEARKLRPRRRHRRRGLRALMPR